MECLPQNKAEKPSKGVEAGHFTVSLSWLTRHPQSLSEASVSHFSQSSIGGQKEMNTGRIKWQLKILYYCRDIAQQTRACLASAKAWVWALVWKKKGGNSQLSWESPDSSPWSCLRHPSPALCHLSCFSGSLASALVTGSFSPSFPAKLIIFWCRCSIISLWGAFLPASSIK